jgi:hypothetical protein
MQTSGSGWAPWNTWSGGRRNEGNSVSLMSIEQRAYKSGWTERYFLKRKKTQTEK